MESARIRRELAELAMKIQLSATPSASATPDSNASSSAVRKRLHTKTPNTPSRTPSTKTPDPKAIKVMEGTPGETKKSLFGDGALPNI